MATVALTALAALFMVTTKARPSYDAMGFLVWGRQALHGDFNLDGAPSWKPLPFLATFPYALAGQRAQEWLWTLTAVTGAGSAVVLAGRLAYRLSPAVPGRTWARAVGALTAALGIATMVGLVHLTLIADSDPLVLALALGAIDCHVSGRTRGTLGLLWLVALGRPEAWPFLLLYSAWVWRHRPAARRLAVIAVIVTPAIWFIVPALTSKSWLLPSDFALGQATAIHGSKLIGVFDRLRTLTALPIQLAALASIVIAALRRDRTVLSLAAIVLLWAVIEVAFALHGYSAVQRYLIEPGGVLIVLVGVGVSTALSSPSGLLRWLGPAAVVVLLLSLAPYVRSTLRTDHGLVSQSHADARMLNRLASVIAAVGGPQRILSCGQPVTPLSSQSTLAWELGVNVGSVQYDVPAATDSRTPVVLFTATRTRWTVRFVGAAGAQATTCARLDRSFPPGRTQ